MTAIVPEAQSAGLLEDMVVARADLWPVLSCVVFAACAFIWAFRQRRRLLQSLGNPRLIARLVGTVDGGNRLLQAVLAVLAVLFISVALLRIQYGGVAKVVRASGLDLLVVVDYSKSMLAKDVYPSRNERLEVELRHFLDDAGQRGDRVGLVIFAGAARGLPVTRDMRLLKLYLEHADPKTENPGGTAIGKAINLALQFLVDARRSNEEEAGAAAVAEAGQAIILLTDGEDTASKPAEVALLAKQLGVRIYTVGIGSKSGDPVQKYDKHGETDGYQTDEEGNYVMTRLDTELLEQLALTTGGQFVQVAPDRFGLDEVRGLLGDLSRARRQDTLEIHREEGFAFVILPALAFLAMALAISDRRRRA